MEHRTLAPNEQITEPGIYSGISMDRYHSGKLCDGPSISSSGLRTIFAKSPAHYWSTSRLNPNRVDEDDDKEAFILGRAAHHLLLGEPDFKKLFTMRPDKWDSWRTDAAKAWRAEQQLAGLTVLEPKQIIQVKGMARELEKHPLMQQGALKGHIEMTVAWKDLETGVWLLVRPDAIPNDSGDYCDLKTITSVDRETIVRSISERSYHMQGALVGEGSRVVLKMPMQSFSLVFTEKKEPHCARVVTIKDHDIERGEKQNHVALRLFKRCLDRSEWPGPGGTQSDAAYVELPGWAPNQIDNRIAELEQELSL